MDDGEEVDLHEGMQVSNEEGDELGTLSALLVEDEDEEAEFFLLKAGDKERLIPFEAVLGVGDGALLVDVGRDALEMYPVVTPGTDPSDADIDRAYEVYDETAQYAEE